jgi:hypothetical protein
MVVLTYHYLVDGIAWSLLAFDLWWKPWSILCWLLQTMATYRNPLWRHCFSRTIPAIRMLWEMVVE